MPRRASLYALVLATVVLVAFAPIVLGGRTWNDTRYHTEIAPPRMAAAEIVQSGELPTWWNGTALGVPLVGEPSHGAAYPFVWLGSTPRLLDLIWIVHVFWCAFGVALWARRLRASDLGAVVAGVLVATSGIVASAALRGALPALAHLPWIGYFASRLSTAKTRDAHARCAAMIALLVGLVGLAGQLAILVHAIAIAVLGGIGRQDAKTPRSEPGWGPFVFAVIAIAAGLAIGAMQWLPALLSFSETAGDSVQAIPLSRIVELVVPGAFGGDARIEQIAGASPSFSSLYVGAPLFALAALASPRRRYAVYAAVLAVLALVVGRGGWPASLGAPDLHVAMLAIIAAVHAGRGFDTVLASERRALIALACAAMMILLALGGLWALRARIDASSLLLDIDRSLVAGGLALLCTACAVLLAWRTTWLAPTAAVAGASDDEATRDDDEPARDGRPLPRPRRTGVDVRSLILVVLFVAPSVGSVALVAPTVDRAFVDEPPAWVNAAIARTDFTVRSDEATAAASAAPLRLFRPVTNIRGDKHAEPETLDDALATLAGASAAKWGIAGARSEDPARPRLHDRVWLAAAGAGGALLERYGIELAILPASAVQGRGLRHVATRGTWSLARYPASPPAALVYEWMFVADVDTSIARLFPPGADRGLSPGVVVLRGEGAANQDEPSDPQPCTIERWSHTAIDLTCVADRPAYAVISSTAAAGWSATVDGRATYWQIADVMRRAVPVAPGTHRIAWRYWPPGLTVGLVLAGLGIALALALWLGYGRRVPDASDDASDSDRTDVN